MPTASALETEFTLWLRTEPDIPEPETEYRFAAPRRWRYRFCVADRNGLPLKSRASHTTALASAGTKAQKDSLPTARNTKPLCWTAGESTAYLALGSESATIPSGDRKLSTR